MNSGTFVDELKVDSYSSSYSSLLTVSLSLHNESEFVLLILMTVAMRITIYLLREIVQVLNILLLTYREVY